MKEYIEPEVEVIEYSLAYVIAASEATDGSDDIGGGGSNASGGSEEGDIPIGGGGSGGIDDF